MGLTVYYDLSLPTVTPEHSVRELLERLRAHAATLTLRAISPMYEYTMGELLDGRPVSWTGLESHFYSFGRINLDKTIAEAAAVGEMQRSAVIGFSVHPGHGCEGSAFGFTRPGLSSPPEDAEPATPWNCWSWIGFCKTQYASVVSNDHLVHCHLALVNMLEEAQRLGATIDVRDDTGYWKHRSVDLLIGEVEKWNSIIARIAGNLHDAVSSTSGESHRVEGSIFEHPDFERLETRGGVPD